MSVRRINTPTLSSKWVPVVDGGSHTIDTRIDDLNYYLESGWNMTVDELLWCSVFQILGTRELMLMNGRQIAHQNTTYSDDASIRFYQAGPSDEDLQSCIFMRRNAIIKFSKYRSLAAVVEILKLHYRQVELYDTPSDFVVIEFRDRNSEPFYYIEWEMFQNHMSPEIIESDVQPFDYTVLQDAILSTTETLE